jgi:hypothetical protein
MTFLIALASKLRPEYQPETVAGHHIADFNPHLSLNDINLPKAS